MSKGAKENARWPLGGSAWVSGWAFQVVVGLCILKVAQAEFVDGLDGSVRERSTAVLWNGLSFQCRDAYDLSTNISIR